MSTAATTYGDAATRQRILAAAWELLEADGNPQLTMADTAKRAAVSRQAVYLHFTDRSGLLVGLVDFIDERLGRDELRAHVFGAATGVESLRRWVEAMSWYTAKINRVTQVLEHGKDHDAGLAAAWRNRMDGRRGHIRRIIDRVAAEGGLAPGWTAEAAVDVVYAITMPGPWRELTAGLGWTPVDYADRIWRLLERGLLTHGPG